MCTLSSFEDIFFILTGYPRFPTYIRLTHMPLTVLSGVQFLTKVTHAGWKELFYKGEERFLMLLKWVVEERRLVRPCRRSLLEM